MLRIVWKAPCSHWTKLLAKWDSVWIRTYYTWSTRLNCDVKQIHMRVWVECSWRSAVQNSAWKKQGREKKKQCSLSWWRKNWGAKDRKISTKYITTICWSSKACMPSMHLHCTAKLWKTHLRWVTFTVKLLWCQSFKILRWSACCTTFPNAYAYKNGRCKNFCPVDFFHHHHQSCILVIICIQQHFLPGCSCARLLQPARCAEELLRRCCR